MITFDEQIQTTTQDDIVPIVVDQTLGSNVLTLAIMSQGKPWMGEQIKFPVKLSSHTQGGSFTDFSTFSVAGENVRKNAAFGPAAYYQSVVIGGIARSVNAINKSQLLNLVKVEMESAMQDMADDIGSLSYGDGTGNGGADFLGADAAIDNGATVDTYGGISRAVDVAWKSVIQTSVGAWD
nr:phage major capsid protein [bacterium]